MSHKFKCQDPVLLRRLGFVSGNKLDTALLYEVVRLMPPDRSGELCYRIKAGTVERFVAESELCTP